VTRPPKTSSSDVRPPPPPADWLLGQTAPPVRHGRGGDGGNGAIVARFGEDRGGDLGPGVDAAVEVMIPSGLIFLTVKFMVKLPPNEGFFLPIRGFLLLFGGVFFIPQKSSKEPWKFISMSHYCSCKKYSSVKYNSLEHLGQM
jgi:hypothetical protein